MGRSTIYDDAFHTMLVECSRLILPLINEVFGEHYTGKEKIIFLQNEHYVRDPEGKTQERITDSNFKVIGETEKKYHWECQSTADDSMLVRFFEYDALMALDDAQTERSVLRVTFPHSAVLFLRSGKTTPEEMRIEIETPGGEVGYPVHVMKAQDYTLEDIFEKNLLFLIPYHIFSYESRFQEYNREEGKLRSLQEEYRRIAGHLEKLSEQGELDMYTRLTLMEMSEMVLEKIAAGYEQVREGVKKVMGGKVLDYEARRIKNEGIMLGRQEGIDEGIALGRRKGHEEGRQEGKLEMLYDLVRNDFISIKDAAAQIGMSEEVFVGKMKSYNP